jgi:anti-sigma factor RsiW
MDINRHNYETFFLLYTDNELSAAERKAVDVFVQENADLKEELHLLEQTVFSAADIVFENKESLLKDEQASLKENLLLYLDKELDAVAVLQTEQLLHTDSAVQKEFALLQKTQLQPDTAIIFADKKSLYRKEEGRVVGFAWWRIAAAAVLLGFGTWGTVSLLNNNKADEPTQVAGTKGVKKTTPSLPALNKMPVQPDQQKTNDIQVNIVIADKGIINASKQKNNQPVQQILPQEAQKNNNGTIAKQDNNKKPGNNLPTPDYNNFNNNNRNEIIASTVPPTDKATDNVNSGKTATVTLPNNNVTDGYALNTKFTQSNGDETSNDALLNMNEDNVKKSKLGGFLRKVKRLVERNANIKTGNGIKVAGFDIAIK